ncbi:MAG: hypothetical protein ACFCVH_22240 [Alphaproteobacteria bacterium]
MSTTRRATALRLAAAAATAAVLAGCLPIMVDRDGNWREPQAAGPAFGSATQPRAAVIPTADEAAAEAGGDMPAEAPAEESAE